MIQTNITELVFILDKSGSMGGLERDTIGGYNAMLTKQKEAPESGECRITTVLFDNEYTLLHDRIDIRAVSPITEEEYQVGGTTALVDAIGITLNKIRNVQKATAEEYRADKVIFVIITDGEENSSREFTSDKVKEMIEHQKKKYGWEFVFLGANIDAVETARQYGIGADRAVDYHADHVGTGLSYKAVSAAVTAFRGGEAAPMAAFETVKEDYKKRKKAKKTRT